MGMLSRISGMLVGLALLLGTPALLPAAEPERLPQRPFDVRIDARTVEVTFTLVLSEVSSYPVTITAIRGTVEEQLWNGSLSEGVYRLRAPLTQISGPGPIRIVLKTRLVKRSSDGNSTDLVYLKWDGSL